jgi:hypothetical protein
VVLLLPFLIALVGIVLSVRAQRRLTSLGVERRRARLRTVRRWFGPYWGTRDEFTTEGWRLRNWALVALVAGVASVLLIFTFADLSR